VFYRAAVLLCCSSNVFNGSTAERQNGSTIKLTAALQHFGTAKLREDYARQTEDFSF
jgi:hypothetical protein